MNGDPMESALTALENARRVGWARAYAAEESLRRERAHADRMRSWLAEYLGFVDELVRLGYLAEPEPEWHRQRAAWVAEFDVLFPPECVERGRERARREVSR